MQKRCKMISERLDKMRSKEKNMVEEYTGKEKNLEERMRGW